MGGSGRALRAAVFATVAAISAISATGAWPQDAPATAAPTDIVATAAACLARRDEVRFATDGIECRHPGTSFRDAHAALLRTDLDAVCRDPAAADPRRLSTQQVLDIVRTARDAPAIRLIGPVFCDTLALVGLDIGPSLVIDAAGFRHGLTVRNFRTKGDLSFDGAMSADEILLVRSRIDGTLFLGKIAVRATTGRDEAAGLRLEDVTIGGNLDARSGFFPGYVQIDRITTAGDMRLSEIGTASLILRHSRIPARLDLDGVESLCRIHVTRNEIGDIFAADAGFGQTGTADNRMAWRRAATRGTSERLASARHAWFADEIACGNAYREFYVFDNRVVRNACIQSVAWLRQGAPIRSSGLRPEPVNILALNGTSVGNALILALFGDDEAVRFHAPHREARKLEMIGVQARALIMDFTEGAHADRFVSALSGLSFERVHHAAVGCNYRADKMLDGQLGLPGTSDVMRWLRTNTAQSAQPFAMVVDAHRKAGAGVRGLLVASAQDQQRVAADKWWDAVSRAYGSAGLAGDIGDRALQMAQLALDGLRLAGNWALGWLAGYGYQPEIAVVWIAAIVIALPLLFRIAFGVSAFKVDRKETILPFGILFFFDRLVPVYKLREDNYRIEKMLAPATGDAKADGATFSSLATHRAYRVVDDATAHRIERALEIVRIVGVMLSLFFAAAIGSLVAR